MYQSKDELFKIVPSEDSVDFYNLLTSNKVDEIRNKLTNSALTFEFNTWQITLYDEDDLDEVIEILQSMQQRQTSQLTQKA